jgi:CHC2 zinc finger
MFSISDESQPGRDSKERGQIRSIQPDTSPSPKELIRQANSVPLSSIFSFYGLRVDHKSLMICPFPDHQGKHSSGRESTASFKYYQESNSFYCFGCLKWGKPVDFVVNCEDIRPRQAALKIIESSLSSEVSFDMIDQGDEIKNISERFLLLLDFADFFREKVLAEPASLSKMEEISKTLDLMMIRHKLTNASLDTLIRELKKKAI